MRRGQMAPETPRSSTPKPATRSAGPRAALRRGGCGGGVGGVGGGISRGSPLAPAALRPEAASPSQAEGFGLGVWLFLWTLS